MSKPKQTPQKKAIEQLKKKWKEYGIGISKDMWDDVDIAISEAEKQGYENGYKHEKEKWMNAYELGKQEGAGNKIIKLFEDLPRIELFARQKIEGWEANTDKLTKAMLIDARQEGADQKVKEIFDDIDIKQWRYFQVKDIIERVRSIEQKHLKEVKK